MVKPMDTASAEKPGVGTPELEHQQCPPAPVASASQAKPGHCTLRTRWAASDRGLPAARPIARQKDSTVTITSRRLCTAATRSVRACSRSASSVISEAAPITREIGRGAQALFVHARLRQHGGRLHAIQPAPEDPAQQQGPGNGQRNRPPQAGHQLGHGGREIQAQCAAYRPLPRSRSLAQLWVGAPPIDSREIEISGPSIHGSGVCSIRQSWAANQASSRVAATGQKRGGKQYGHVHGNPARHDNGRATGAMPRSIAVKLGGQSRYEIYSYEAMPRLRRTQSAHMWTFISCGAAAPAFQLWP